MRSYPRLFAFRIELFRSFGDASLVLNTSIFRHPLFLHARAPHKLTRRPTAPFAVRLSSADASRARHRVVECRRRRRRRLETDPPSSNYSDNGAAPRKWIRPRAFRGPPRNGQHGVLRDGEFSRRARPTCLTRSGNIFNLDGFGNARARSHLQRLLSRAGVFYCDFSVLVSFHPLRRLRPLFIALPPSVHGERRLYYTMSDIIRAQHTELKQYTSRNKQRYLAMFFF